MKTQYDLSQLDWKLSGWTPYLWRMSKTTEIGATPGAEVTSIPAKAPGSVQYALREAGIIPDWNMGLNARECEWVENRHWIYEAVVPDEWIEPDKTYRLNCRGLDYCGWVIVNGETVSEFEGTHIPHIVDLTEHLTEKGNVVRIVFDVPPRWLGQFGFTSQMTDWKARFYYTWDWVVRLVQVGIWNSIYLEKTDGVEIGNFRCTTSVDVESCVGTLEIGGHVSGDSGAVVRLSLAEGETVLKEQDVPASEFSKSGLRWTGVPVKLWWPNLEGDQPLYTVNCRLVDSDGNEMDSLTRRVGFRSVTWAPCEDAPEEADNNLCVVNGRPVFLQGVNWVPILPNFADVTPEDYRKRLTLYRELGCNLMRVWGGAVLERTWFYDLCDELGLMVWQEMPMSSSGGSSTPATDEKSISEMAAIAESYIARRHHHASLIVWSGGNELTGSDASPRKPADFDHPMIGRLRDVAMEHDPTRRFFATSPSGPSSHADPAKFGKGVHWHVHGPWKADGNLDEHWTDFWRNDDSNLRTETGAPGASSVEIIRKYAGDCEVMPATPMTNPLWRRTSSWWIEWDQFVAEHGREPNDIEEYVAWNQERQARALSIACKACKDRFPRCGGFVVWMGHDCFPCNANTSIVDFNGDPKPAALALKEIWRSVKA